MKYIRTKDKVLEFIPFSGGKDGEVCSYRNAKKVYKIGYLEIIKQFDTIEELCDGYFAISNTDYKTPIKIDFDKKIIYQWQGNMLVVPYTFEQFIPYHTIYGAI